MSKQQQVFDEGDVVFAKVKGYPPWPARIIAAAKGKYPVLFYGTNESANCKQQDVFGFAAFEEKYGKITKPAFVKAMTEAREELEGGGKANSDMSNRRSTRSDKAQHAKPKNVTKDEDEKDQSEDSEEEQKAEPKKRAKPAPKTKKAPASKTTKKAPTRRPSRQTAPPTDSSDDEDVPLAKSAAMKTKPPAKRGGKTASGTARGRQRQATKAVSSNESGDEDDAKTTQKSSRKRKSDDGASDESNTADSSAEEESNRADSSAEEESGEDQNGNEQSDASSVKKSGDGSGSEEGKPAKKRAPAKQASTVSKGNKPRPRSKRKPPAARGRATKRSAKSADVVEEEENGSDEDKESSKSASVSRSASGSKSSTDSSHSSSTSGSDAEEDGINEAKPAAEVTKGLPDEPVDEQVEVGADKPNTSGDGESLAVSKEHVTSLPEKDAQKSVDDSEPGSATNSSVEDDEVIHSSRAHKSHSKHTVLSESDSERDEAEPKEEEKDLEQMLAERKKEHLELKHKRRQEKMEERRRRQLQREKEHEEERKQKEEKKRLHQQRVKTEKKLRELDEVIKRSLAVSTKDVTKCLEAMTELDELDIVAAMLVKYPAIIDTLKKCRKYKADSHVMTRADSLCNKLRTVATSDKSALTALNKQKTDKQKTKKEEQKLKESNVEPPAAVPADPAAVSSTKELLTTVSTDRQTVATNPDSAAIPAVAATTQPNHAQTGHDDMDIDDGDSDTNVPATSHTDTRALDTLAPTAADTSQQVSLQPENKENGATADVVDSAKAAGDALDSQHDSKPDIGLLHDDATSAIGSSRPSAIVVGSVSDLKVMAKEELPSEDVLTAGIQALIAKTQESNAILDQVIKQKKEKRYSASSARKRRKLDSGLHETSRSSVVTYKHSTTSKPSSTVARTTSPSRQPGMISRTSLSSRKSAELDDLDIDDLLGI